MEPDPLSDAYAARFRSSLQNAGAARLPTDRSTSWTSLSKPTSHMPLGSPEYPRVDHVMQFGASNEQVSTVDVAADFLAEYRAALAKAANVAEGSASTGIMPGAMTAGHNYADDTMVEPLVQPANSGPSLASPGGPLSPSRGGVDASYSAMGHRAQAAGEPAAGTRVDQTSGHVSRRASLQFGRDDTMPAQDGRGADVYEQGSRPQRFDGRDRSVRAIGQTGGRPERHNPSSKARHPSRERQRDRPRNRRSPSPSSHGNGGYEEDSHGRDGDYSSDYSSSSGASSYGGRDTHGYSEDDDDQSRRKGSRRHKHAGKRPARGGDHGQGGRQVDVPAQSPVLETYENHETLQQQAVYTDQGYGEYMEQPTVVDPSQGLVLVPISALRDNAEALAEAEKDIRQLQADRDGLLVQLDSATARLSVVDAERESLSVEATRLRSSLAMKDEIIAMLHTQLAGAQGGIVQAAANAAAAAANGAQAQSQAMGMGIVPTIGLPGGQASPGAASTVSEEEFLLLSDEVGNLQGQVTTLQAQLGQAEAALVHSQQELASAKAELEAAGLPGQAVSKPGAAAPDAAAIGPYGTSAAFKAALGMGADGPAKPPAERNSDLPSSKVLGRSHMSYDDLNNENTRLRQQLAASEEEADMLRVQAQGAGVQRADLESRLARQAEDVDKARAALDSARLAASESDREAKKLAANLAASEADADRAKRRVLELESRLEAQARSLEGAQADARSASAALDDARRSLAGMSREVEELREAVRAKGQEVQAAKGEAQAAQEALRRSQADVARLQAQLVQAQQQLAQLSAQVAAPPPVVARRGAPSYSQPHPAAFEPQPASGRPDRQEQPWPAPVPAPVPAPGRYAPFSQQQSGGMGAVMGQYEGSGHARRPSVAEDNSYSGFGGSGASSTVPGPLVRSPGRHGAAQAARAHQGDSRARLFGDQPQMQEDRPRARQVYSEPEPVSQPSPGRRRLQAQAANLAPWAQAPQEDRQGRQEGHSRAYSQPSSPQRQKGVLQAAPPAQVPGPAPVPAYPVQQPQPPPVPAYSQPQAPVYEAPAMPTNPYGRPTAPAAPVGNPYGSVGVQPNPYGSAGGMFAGPSSSGAPPVNAAAAERARRLAMLADIAHNTGQGARPPPVPVPPPMMPGGFGGYGYGPGPQAGPANPYDAYAMAASEAGAGQDAGGDPYKRIRAAATSEGGHVMNSNASSMETVKALPFGAEAARAAEEEDRALAQARPNKLDADEQSRHREAAAPFATEAAVQSLEAQVASKEAALLSANVAKGEVEAELKRLQGAGARTVRDRARKAELEGQMQVLDKQLGELRRWIKTHAP